MNQKLKLRRLPNTSYYESPHESLLDRKNTEDDDIERLIRTKKIQDSIVNFPKDTDKTQLKTEKKIEDDSSIECIGESRAQTINEEDESNFDDEKDVSRKSVILNNNTSNCDKKVLFKTDERERIEYHKFKTSLQYLPDNFENERAREEEWYNDVNKHTQTNIQDKSKVFPVSKDLLKSIIMHDDIKSRDQLEGGKVAINIIQLQPPVVLVKSNSSIKRKSDKTIPSLGSKRGLDQESFQSLEEQQLIENKTKYR